MEQKVVRGIEFERVKEESISWEGQRPRLIDPYKAQYARSYHQVQGSNTVVSWR